MIFEPNNCNEIIDDRVIECKGPTNGRTYTVAVYFKGQRLAAAHGHNIQQAEMNAASKALENSKGKVTYFVLILHGFLNFNSLCICENIF